MPYDNNIYLYIQLYTVDGRIQNAHAIRDRPRLLPVLPPAIIGLGGQKKTILSVYRSNDDDIRLDGGECERKRKRSVERNSNNNSMGSNVIGPNTCR